MSTWQNDEELLASLKEALREAAAVPRRFVELGKAAYDRRLTYTTAELIVEIDITEDAIVGQILPPQPGTAWAYGTMVTTRVDESGAFVLRPVPASPFRLRCVTASGVDVVTGPITASEPPRR